MTMVLIKNYFFLLLILLKMKQTHGEANLYLFIHPLGQDILLNLQKKKDILAEKI